MLHQQPNLIKRLVFLFNHLEENLSSLKLIEEKFHEYVLVHSQTQQSISQDLTRIKNLLNEKNFDEDYDEMVQIDGTKSEWNDEDDDEEEEEENARIQTNSPYMKKSPRSLSSVKSSKSVTFHLDQQYSQQHKKRIPTFQQFSKEKKTLLPNNLTTPNLPLTDEHFSNENQCEKKSTLTKLSKIIRIHEIECKNGDYLRLINLSKTEDYDLSEHFLQQNLQSKIYCRFHFPSNTILRAGQTITVWCGRTKNIEEQPPNVLLWKEQRKWQTKSETITILAKANGQTVASFRNNYRFLTDQSSSDVLHVHSKINGNSSGISNNSSNSSNLARRVRKSSRLSTFNFLGNSKPPFTYPPTHPIHPDSNGTNLPFQQDQRSQINHKNTFSELLNRPKSSPFTSHAASKDDLIEKHLLQKQRQKQSINQN